MNLREKHKERDSSDPAVKGDGNKRRWDLLPVEALEAVVDVYTYGATKYEDHNWTKGMKWSRLFGAMMRHSWAFWRGETYDPETGIHHMAHAAWNCLGLVHFTLYKPEFDDRLKNDEMVEGIRINLSKLPEKKRNEFKKALGIK